jgi:hypothetical protein
VKRSVAVEFESPDPPPASQRQDDDLEDQLSLVFRDAAMAVFRLVGGAVRVRVREGDEPPDPPAPEEG